MQEPYAEERWLWRDRPGRGPAVIFDVDGVLADASGRQHFLETGDWRGFFDACADDEVIRELHELGQLLDPNLLVVLVTGRPRRVRDETVAWLARHEIRWDLLVMREHGDYSGVTEFKRGVVAELRRRDITPRLAIDDDPGNHAMYVAEGVPCLYVHSGYYN